MTFRLRQAVFVVLWLAIVALGRLALAAPPPPVERAPTRAVVASGVRVVHVAWTSSGTTATATTATATTATAPELLTKLGDCRKTADDRGQDLADVLADLGDLEHDHAALVADVQGIANGTRTATAAWTVPTVLEVAGVALAGLGSGCAGAFEDARTPCLVSAVGGAVVATVLRVGELRGWW